MGSNVVKLDQIIFEFLMSRDFQEIETLADMIGDIGDKKAIGALVSRLGDYFTEKDGDIEDAICTSLVKLGVMKKTGTNLMFEILEENLLSSESLEIVKTHKNTIPDKYFKKGLSGFPNTNLTNKYY